MIASEPKPTEKQSNSSSMLMAVWALGEIGLSAREAIPALERLLRDNDSPEDLATTVEVLQALKKMGHHAGPAKRPE